nr:DUF4128 domain-containing protein [Pseudoxanthomonas sp.]
MTQPRIREALETRLNTWAAAQSPAVPVAWQNVAYTPTTGTRYVRASLLSGETQNPIYGALHRRLIGMLQVDIVAPTGTGMAASEALAESLCTEFKRGTTLTQDGLTVVMDFSPSIGPAMIEGGWVMLPVSIRYRADDFAA